MESFVDLEDSEVLESIAHEEQELREAAEDDLKYVDWISKLPPSSETRVISFGLYGNNYKYTNGAIENAKVLHFTHLLDTFHSICVLCFKSSSFVLDGESIFSWVDLSLLCDRRCN